MANKRDVTRKVYDKLEGITLMDVTLIINTFLETVEETLETGESVILTNFGSFNVADRAEKCCADPITRERITVPAYKAVVFRASAALKRVVNHKKDDDDTEGVKNENSVL